MIDAWVTTPAGVVLDHLERSRLSPFRGFAFSRVRNKAGPGSLEYHLDNARLAEFRTEYGSDLLELGNLVWMQYRTKVGVWIIEDEVVVLDENEHATDWVKVGGRGALQLLQHRLVFPNEFLGGANLDPSTWPSQWTSYVGLAAGEMLWDMISQTNPRFATQIVRGTVENTPGDNWTQDFRFETLLADVIEPATAAHGDVHMEGLTFNYYNRLGSDRSGAVVFEEGADLRELRFERTDRPRVSYLVGEGVGEGVFAKLAVASRPDALRVEGFAAFKDATNEPLLQVLTDAEMAEHDRREQIAFEVTEDRYEALTDYDYGDDVRIISQSRGIDRIARIDAIYLAEDGDAVRVAMDIAGLRGDVDTGLSDDVGRTRTELGVRNRQPQGQLVPFSFNGADVFDSTDTMDVFLFVPDRIYVTIEAKAQLHFREFFAPATAATSDGGSTSGPSSATTTDNSGPLNHFHIVANAPAAAGAFTKRKLTPGPSSTTGDINIETSSAGQIATFETGSLHNHGMPHTHPVDPHDHDLTFGVYKEAFPGSHSVEVRTYERVAGVWTLRDTITGLTDDLEEIDLTAVIDGPGSWKLEIKSAAAQPQGGRLGCDVAGYVLGAIKSS